MAAQVPVEPHVVVPISAVGETEIEPIRRRASVKSYLPFVGIQSLHLQIGRVPPAVIPAMDQTCLAPVRGPLAARYVMVALFVPVGSEMGFTRASPGRGNEIRTKLILWLISGVGGWAFYHVAKSFV